METVSVDGATYLKEGKALVETLLDKYLPSVKKEPESLHKAMRYSALAGGKRLRPILCMAAYECCGGNLEGDDLPIHYAMAALESVHTYSLIHDDLPCMDDDDLRRGILTCHKKYGDALAVLAGDALHVVAFEMMARTGSLDAIIELAAAIGTSGMLGGQVADVEAEGKTEVTQDEVLSIHRRKTGALLASSVKIGAILANARPEHLMRLSCFGEKLGLAFQIVDDILDVEGDQKLLGKIVGSDSKNQKATYPAAVGMERARDDASKLIDEALSELKHDDNNMLVHIARFVGQRNN